MKWIEKGEEPTAFKEWKDKSNDEWTPSYEILSNPEKSQLHEALLKDQGYICCYCNDRIEKPTPRSHIEHIKPRSHFPAEALNFTNLVSSCQGENEKRFPIHCGPAKADWPNESAFRADLMISPLDKNCENEFSFTGLGEIRSSHTGTRNAAAKETITRLGLDVPKLDAARRSSIDGILEGIEDETDENIQRLIAHFSNKDDEGRFIPFCSAVVYTLKKYLNATQNTL